MVVLELSRDEDETDPLTLSLIEEEKMLKLAWDAIERSIMSDGALSLDAAKFAIVKLTGLPSQSSKVELDASVTLTKEEKGRKLVQNLKALGLVA